MSFLKNLACKRALKSIRHYRFVQWIYNFSNRKNLRYLKPLYKSFGVNKNYLSTIQSKDLEVDFSGSKHEAEQLRPISITEASIFNQLNADYQKEILNWETQGYVHLKNFFEENEIDLMTLKTEELWSSDYGKWRLGDRRVLSAFRDSKTWDFFHQEKFKNIVELLLGQESVLLNNISFIRGDEQPIHSDSFYMSTYPIGNLIGSWIALEDIDINSGPLRYIPGSHLLPYTTNKDIKNGGSWLRTGVNGDNDYIDFVKNIVEENNYTPQYFLPKKGDLLLWHANLLHGGSEVLDSSKSRKSMVGHFVGKNVICYHENSQRPAFRFERPNR